MNIVNTLHNEGNVHSFNDLAEIFAHNVLKFCRTTSTTIAPFDTYRDGLLKNNTREKRKWGVTRITFEVADHTDITNISMKQILSHLKTKNAAIGTWRVKLFRS